MEYLTLHELARHFNKPERQIRYRFRELTKAGKLTEGEDFRKEDFVDEFHFAYKVNPLRFMEEAKLPVDPPSLGSNSDTKEGLFASNPDIPDEPIGTTEQEELFTPVTKDDIIGSHFASNQGEIATNDPNLGTNQNEGTLGNIWEDYILTLKEQLRVKDDQIAAYKDQLALESDMSKRAVGEILGIFARPLEKVD